jgi:hypothetical protein
VFRAAYWHKPKVQHAAEPDGKGKGSAKPLDELDDTAKRDAAQAALGNVLDVIKREFRGMQPTVHRKQPYFKVRHVQVSKILNLL